MFIKNLFPILIILFSFTQAQSQITSKPNVIIILADDLGYGDLSINGQRKWSTPNIDLIAQEGARLTNFYTPTPYCAPTRASLLTGRYPARHTLTKNPNPEKPNNFQTYRGGDSIGIPDKELLLSEILKQEGYGTKIIGKWHLGHKPPFFPTRHGFDEYLGIPYSNDMRPVILMENEKTIEYPVVQSTLTKRYTDSALEFIEKNKKKPFFLYLPQAMPHKPLAVSEDFYHPEIKGSLYGNAVRELDWSVGEVLKKIKKEGLEENTIIIFLSDNGPWFGGSTGGLRGMKSQNWEGGIRVPFLIKWKNVIPSGNINHEPAGVIDVWPTLASLLKIKTPASLILDGKDITSLLKSSSAKSPHEVLYSFYADDMMTVRNGKWKLHLHSPEPTKLPSDSTWVDPRWPDGVTLLAPFEQSKANQFPGIKTGVAPKAFMLFDLESDPSEQKDVAAQFPEVVKKLKERAESARFN